MLLLVVWFAPLFTSSSVFSDYDDDYVSMTDHNRRLTGRRQDRARESRQDDDGEDVRGSMRVGVEGDRDEGRRRGKWRRRREGENGLGIGHSGMAS